MDKAQLDELIATSIEHRDVQARQVSIGFIVAGNRRFLFTDTMAPKAQQSFEAIAATAAEAGVLVENFLATGSFHGIQAGVSTN